jgi:uncharacterized membrane protein (DUF2068 family)
MNTNLGMRSVATFDAIVGFFLLMGGIGLVAIAHRNPVALSQHLLVFFHLSSSSIFASSWLNIVQNFSAREIMMIGILMISYSLIRIMEAYGLWYHRRWGAWLAIILCGFFIPMELYNILNHVSLYNLFVLGFNIWIVYLMVKALKDKTAV